MWVRVGMTSIVEDRAWHGHGNVAQQAQFGEVPIGTVSEHLRLREDLPTLRLKQFTEQIIKRDGVEMTAMQLGAEFRPGLVNSRLERCEVFASATSRFVGNQDCIAHGVVSIFANRSCTTTSDRANWPPLGMAGFTALPTAIMKPITWSLGRLMISATFTWSKPIIGHES